jgi:hypothetical protein
LDGPYDYEFLPLYDAEDMERGLSFLKGLHGAGYNYSALLLTLMPHTWKSAFQHLPSWLTLEDPRDHTHPIGLPTDTEEDAHLEPYPHDDDYHHDYEAGYQQQEQAHAFNQPPPPQQQHSRVFCSQMALMLCQICRALPVDVMDPAACTPSELACLLRSSGKCHPCHRDAISVVAVGASV